MVFSEETKSKIAKNFLKLGNLQLSDQPGCIEEVELHLEELKTKGRMWRFDQLCCEYFFNDFDESHLKPEVRDFVAKGGIYHQSDELMEGIMQDFLTQKAEYADSIDEDNFFSKDNLDNLISFYPIISNHAHMFINYKINRWSLKFYKQPESEFYKQVEQYIGLANSLEDFNNGNREGKNFIYTEMAGAGWALLSIGLKEEALHLWSNMRKLIEAHKNREVEQSYLDTVRFLGDSGDAARYMISTAVALGKCYDLIGDRDAACQVYAEACNYWINNEEVDPLIRNGQASVVHYWSGAGRVIECAIEGYLLAEPESDLSNAFKNTAKNIFCGIMKKDARPENTTDALRETLYNIYFITKTIFK